MKIKRLAHQIFLFFVMSSSVFSQGDRLFPKIEWSQLSTLPKRFGFDGEISGYLSIFVVEGSWHIFLFNTRSALKDHAEMCFFQISSEGLGNALGIVAFAGNEKLLKSLDQRYVRISGSFRTAESSSFDNPYLIDEIHSLSWRGKDGTWTTDKTNGLGESPLKDGRLLAFPDAVFFTHD